MYNVFDIILLLWMGSWSANFYDGAFAREERIQLNALLERDQREDIGFGD